MRHQGLWHLGRCWDVCFQEWTLLILVPGDMLSSSAGPLSSQEAGVWGAADLPLPLVLGRTEKAPSP